MSIENNTTGENKEMLNALLASMRAKCDSSVAAQRVVDLKDELAKAIATSKAMRVEAKRLEGIVKTLQGITTNKVTE